MLVRWVTGSREPSPLCETAPSGALKNVSSSAVFNREVLPSRGSVRTRSCPECTRRWSLDRLTSYLSAASQILTHSAFCWVYFMYVSM